MMKAVPLISVVIPAYNEEKYLPRCLASLNRQTYPRSQFEVVVVDNASTDATARIAEEFGARVVREPKKGVARARQRGFAEAKGEIIASTDADVELPPDWLENVAACFARHPQAGGMTGPVYLYDGGAFVRTCSRYVNTAWVWLLNVLGIGAFSGNNFAVRREPFWQVDGFRRELVNGEDTDLGFRMRRVTKLVFDPRTIVYASARRTREGYIRIVLRAAATHFRVWFLYKHPVGFTDIR
jgi:glycosyltransferase involved in cell wall biosynthesis